MKSKKAVYRYDNEDDKAKVSPLFPCTACCIVHCSINAALQGWHSNDSCNQMLVLLTCLVTCCLQESALEEFLFGSGAAVSKLLAKPEDDGTDIADLVRQVRTLLSRVL
jgi:hypothetical protein